MSCIAGVHRGEGVAREAIESLLGFMRKRAPHGVQVHSSGPIGLGLSHLRTGSSEAEAMPPLTLDGQIWIAADARIDGREALIDQLRRSGATVTGSETHAALILLAYKALGDAFLEHLIGDFAFALWDEPAQRLLCARDHFGIRPLHYACAGNMFAFASDPAALLALPQVSRELDETSVADFLLFGTLQDPDRSMYRDVRALPPAHVLEVDSRGLRIRRYWQGPRRGEIRYARRAQYVEHFAGLFQQSVADRCPGGPVAVQLSGGMDSTSIAAATVRAKRADGDAVVAYHVSCKNLVEGDDEQEFAELVAAHLGFPLSTWDLGRYRAFDRVDEEALRTSCPVSYPCLSAHRDIVAHVTQGDAAVIMSGQGGDAVLAPDGAQVPALLARREWRRLLREVLHHARHTGGLRGLGLRSLRPGTPATRWVPSAPQWLEPAFAQRCDYQQRWARGWEVLNGPTDPVTQLTDSWASRQFEATELLDLPVVARYPFLDLRLFEYLLAVPNFVRAGKWVLRESMRGILPLQVLRRSKSPLPGNFKRAIVTRSNWDAMWPRTDGALWGQWVSVTGYRAALEAYVRGERSVTPWVDSLVLAPLAFGHWLRNSSEGNSVHERSA